jgi:hypothetical protein
MSLDEYISRLNFFNKKAEKLQRLSFMRSVISQPPQVTSRFLFEPPSSNIQAITPHEESIDAFLYTFRFFMIGNEEISFRRMPELYEQLPITEERKQRFRSGRDKLNSFLDSETNYRINEETLTYRHIMDTIIYGGLGHANDRRRVKEYEMWEVTAILPFLEVEFIYVIASVFKMIWYFRSFHIEILEELEQNSMSGQ